MPTSNYWPSAPTAVVAQLTEFSNLLSHSSPSCARGGTLVLLLALPLPPVSDRANHGGPMPEPADRRSAVQLWVLLVAQRRRYTGSRMPAPQRQRLGCGGCMDGRAEQGSSQAAEKR